MASQVISFHYTLTSRAGEQLDFSRGQEPFSFLTEKKQIIPGLEKELLGMKPGDKRQIAVAAKEAYGSRRDELVVRVPREKLPGSEVKVGDRFRGGPEDDAPVFRVSEISESEATLDANHPLAGVDLVFDVEIVATRAATPEEIQHGHAHDGHGHH